MEARLQGASAPHAGSTSAAKRSLVPSVEKTGLETPPGTSVFFSASPPAVGRKKTCGSPARVETNASVFPSGEKKGWLSFAPEKVI